MNSSSASSEGCGTEWADENCSNSSSDADWSEDDESEGKSLLWLCQEGQLDRALERVRGWDDEIASRTKSDDTKQTNSRNSANSDDPIRRDLLQINTDGNYALHEILMGGTTDSAAAELIHLLVSRCCVDYPTESRAMFAATPPSHGRTLLHWAAWGNADVAVLELIMRANPEALCQRDNASHGSRTPREISERYWPDSAGTTRLQRWTVNYLPHRLRRTLHLCVHRHFVTNAQTPFDNADRRASGLAPRPWFVASVMGYALQREMTELALHILSFIGKGAKVGALKSEKKRGAKRRKRHTET
mmetsp:Transcript_2051/g.3704  ORF Transcript_2051/g.3704 Transcript_2051/m.3704 type:complete len:303 (+) Transcript_2051:412-1320(+)